jgi:hypothetical protein
MIGRNRLVVPALASRIELFAIVPDLRRAAGTCAAPSAGTTRASSRKK